MNSIVAKIAAILLSILLLVYIGYQAYLGFYHPYKSEIVRQGTYIHDIDLDGFFVRNEKAIETQKQGVIRYRFNNSEKISKDTVVANIYQQESDLYNLIKLEKLQVQKDMLSKAQASNQVEQLDVLTALIKSTQLELIRQVDEHDFKKLDQTYNDLLLNLNKVDVSINGSTGFTDAINTLNKQIIETKEQISTTNMTVKSQSSGYFSNVVDGYEDVFTPNMLKSLSVSGVQEQLDNKIVSNNDFIGKIQYDSNWSFVALINASDAQHFKVDQEITVKFSSQSTKQVNATVAKVITEKNNTKSVVVFSSSYLDEDFATMRFEKSNAIINSYFGIQIPKEAIRMKDGKKGVYTLLGKTVRFKLIDPLYEDKYILVSKSNVDSQYVSVYDNVITKGNDLHETAK